MECTKTKYFTRTEATNVARRALRIRKVTLYPHPCPLVPYGERLHFHLTTWPLTAFLRRATDADLWLMAEAQGAEIDQDNRKRVRQCSDIIAPDLRWLAEDALATAIAADLMADMVDSARAASVLADHHFATRN